MRVLLNTDFAASRKEPLAIMFGRILTAFQEAGIGRPQVQFSLADAPLPGHVSSVDRVLKRYPGMAVFLQETSPGPPFPVTRQISNQGRSAEPVDLDVLQAILAGVPKSFPFHNIMLVFVAPAFGEGSYQSPLGEVTPGVVLGDSWWVSGRTRSLTAYTFVEAEVLGKKLPPLPEPVAALYLALGKAKKTVQFPLPGENAAVPQAASSEVLAAVKAVVVEYKARLPALLEQIAFPHDLPPMLEALQNTPMGQSTGPKKPVLVKAFRPMGYDCASESGVFTLRRQTPANLTLELSLDVGTWSRSLTAGFSVHGVGFRVPITLQVSRRAGPGQYPIGDQERWQRIVDNLVAFVRELETNLVPAVEAAAGPSPAWFRP